MYILSRRFDNSDRNFCLVGGRGSAISIKSFQSDFLIPQIKKKKNLYFNTLCPFNFSLCFAFYFDTVAGQDRPDKTDQKLDFLKISLNTLGKPSRAHTRKK
jgi:hypothetical protein